MDHDILKDPENLPDDTEAEHKRQSYLKLVTIHKNLGHPSNTVMVRILQEAKAPKSLIDLAKTLECEVCARMVRVRPARPVKSYAPKVLGETLGLDLSLFKQSRTEKLALVLHQIDEASKLHRCTVIKEGVKTTESGQVNHLGNIDAKTLIKSLELWLRYYDTPKYIHCDSEGCFGSKDFLDWCNSRGIRVITCAGEAHWQIGIVERHIATVTDQAQKLALELQEDTPTQTILDLACEAKNSYGRYGGYSPSQWLLGKNNPLAKTDDIPPATADEPYSQHLQRRALAAKHFIEAEARTLLRIASYARARKVPDFQPGDIVYYYRRGRSGGAKQTGRFLGPAKILAIEPAESKEVESHSVIWLAHGVQMIRAAPEHLRRATQLEIGLSQYNTTNTRVLPSHAKGLQPHFVDLGAPPTAEESGEIESEGDRGEEPPRKKARRSRTVDPGPIDVVPEHMDDDDDDSPIDFTAPRGLPPMSDEPDAHSDIYQKPMESPKYSSPTTPSKESPSTARSRTPRRELAEEKSTEFEPYNVDLREFIPEAPTTPDRPTTGGAHSPAPAEVTPPVAPEPVPSPLPTDTSLSHSHHTDLKDNNANIGYAYFLQSQTRQHKGKYYEPNVTITKDSKDPKKIRKSQWPNYIFEYSVDVYDDDVEFFNNETKVEGLRRHFAYVSSEAKRHAEVTIKTLTPKEKVEFEAAKNKELDQWVSNEVFRIVRKAGVPQSRIMSMRWVLTWKAVDDDPKQTRKAKARLVVKGFTDPDLITLRAESPTLSRLSKHWILQTAASKHWTITKGDVKTAFLQGNRTEAQRDVYVEPTV